MKDTRKKFFCETKIPLFFFFFLLSDPFFIFYISEGTLVFLYDNVKAASVQPLFQRHGCCLYNWLFQSHEAAVVTVIDHYKVVTVESSDYTIGLTHTCSLFLGV